MNDQKDNRPENEKDEPQEVQNNEDVNVSEAVKPAEEKKSKLAKPELNINIDLTSKSFIKSAALVLLSLLLLIFAFCPIISYKGSDTYGYYDRGEYETEEYNLSMGISAGKGIGYFFDAVKSESEKKLAKSDLMDDYEDIYEEAMDEEEEMSEDGIVTSKYRRLQEEAFEIAFRLLLRSEDISPALDGYFVPLFSLALIVVSIVLFLYSLLNLFYELTGMDSIVNIKLLEKSKVWSVATKLLAAIPGLILVLYYLLFTGIGINDAFVVTGVYFNSSMAATAVIAIILSVGALIALAVMRIKDKELVVDKNVRKRIISAALALIFIFVACAPIATYKVNGDAMASGDAVKVGVKANLFHRLRLGEYSYIGAYGGNDGFEDNEAAPYVLGEIISHIDVTEDGIDVVYSCVIIAIDIMVIFAVVILMSALWQLAFGIIQGKRQLGMRIWGLVISIPVSLLSVFMAILFVAEYSTSTADGSFGIATILYFVVALLMLIFVPKDKKVKKAKEVEEVKEEVKAE